MLDETDRQIIEELTKNSRIPMKELGEKVHLTGQATASRVIKLEEKGVIEGYTLKTNDKKMGYHVHAFLEIFTKNLHHKPYLSFVASHHAYVIRNYKVSGQGCYLLECKFPTNEELDQFLLELNLYVNYKLTIVIR
ncbi:Lrp/AsnC family transcriptional regulator [Saliterribacillus persicus]|uniref:AsnC family transcriptional regulator n=1 Tax=Saliterribacillus persicus TaxID=930114 RepID=A0A368XDY8_9BACI|nr:Lrp/AsnC family transcriptional regulator [Saliterribacillus persicus]RCW64224.1 AsnC family transcriptional regulator [Saliterribacillus persicus]